MTTPTARGSSFYRTGVDEGVIQAIEMLDSRLSGEETLSRIRYVMGRLGKSQEEIEEVLGQYKWEWDRDEEASHHPSL
jgi:hypothetical protein